MLSVVDRGASPERSRTVQEASDTIIVIGVMQEHAAPNGNTIMSSSVSKFSINDATA